MEDRKQMIKEGNNLWKAKPFFSKKKKKQQKKDTKKYCHREKEGKKTYVP